MTANLLSTATDILNRVAAEVGLDPVVDPYSTTDRNFIQMTYLLNIAGEELCQLYPWETLVRKHSITTTVISDGEYDLPDDYLYMINQTGWEKTQEIPLFGPMSAQQWSYQLNQDFNPIYANFRIQQGKFNIYPPTDGLEISFEYICRCWVLDADTGDTVSDRVNQGADIPLFDRTLISRMVKVKYLEAKNLDTTKAQADLNQMFQQLTSHDKGAPMLNAGRGGSWSRRYLNGWNAPDTGYGF
jgi:hypothetical protein